MSDTSTTTEPSELDLAIERIAAEVEENDAVDRSAELLIGQLAQQLRDAASGAEEAAPEESTWDEPGSPVLTALIARLNGLADSLDSSQGRLSAAVVAGTPASPDAPEPVPSQAAVDAAIESGEIVIPPSAVTQELVDAAVEAGTVTLPAAPAVEGESFLEGDFEPEVQPDPPAGTADLGTPSEGNENDPAFNSGTVDPVDETVVEDEPVVETSETTESGN
jgi:hypothetical protein